MSLQGVRQSVDRLDAELIKVLGARLENAIRARRFKGAVQDTKREEEILARVKLLSPNIISNDFLEKVMQLVLAESRTLQEMNPRLAVFHGEHGSYDELALISHDEAVMRIPCKDLSQMFEALENGSVDYGIAPIENSLEGTRIQTLDYLIQKDLKIIDEIVLPISYCFLVLPGSDHKDIKDVLSSPEALEHCQGFLKRNKLDAIPFHDTAAAATWLTKERPKGTAVIASELCGQLYDLEALKVGIGDTDGNVTRYLLLAKESRPSSQGTKCSMVITLKDQAGSLMKVLEVFAKNKINLTKLESRPTRVRPGEIGFLLDFEGTQDSNAVQGVLDTIPDLTTHCKILGWYHEKAINPSVVTR